MTKLERIAELAEKATPGPWSVRGCEKHPDSGYELPCVYVRDAKLNGVSKDSDNRAFIAASREAVPWLVETLQEAIRLIESAVPIVQRLDQQDDWARACNRYADKMDTFLENVRREVKP